MMIPRPTLRLAALLAALLTAACSPNRMIGNHVKDYTVKSALPVIMRSDDIPVICHANDGMTPLVMSFTPYGVETDMMLAFGNAGSSVCLENEAFEQELRSTLAEQQGWADVALDARIAQQLHNREAGLRQLRAYQYTVAYFKAQRDYELGEGKCPKLKQDVDELLLLVGATSALQGLQNDVASGRLVEIDMGVPPKVVRAMSCLDNRKWWGFPKSVQAALQVILPESPEQETQGWDALRQATDIGLDTGMRLSHATYAVVASIKGREDYLRDALKRFEAYPAQKLDARYALLDQIASIQMRRIADRLWMKYQGHRAPTQNYSQFWDEQAKPSQELNQLLDDTPAP